MKKKELKIVKSSLPRNYSAILAKKHGVTRSYVNMVLNETRKNAEIKASIFELIEECIKAKTSEAQKLKALTEI